MNQLKVARNLVVWERSPLNLSGWMPSRWCALSSLFLSSGRSVREKGSSPVPHGWWGGLSRAVWDDRIPKDPKTSLYFGLSSLSLSLLLLGLSNGVRGLFFCSCSANFVAAITASAMELDSLVPMVLQHKMVVELVLHFVQGEWS